MELLVEIGCRLGAGAITGVLVFLPAITSWAGVSARPRADTDTSVLDASRSGNHYLSRIRLPVRGVRATSRKA